MCICDECRKIEFFSNVPTEDLQAEIDRRYKENMKKIRADEISVIWTCPECGIVNATPFDDFDDNCEFEAICENCDEDFIVMLP